MRRIAAQLVAPLLLFAILIASAGCASTAREKPTLAYGPEAFRAALLERVPNLPPRLSASPHAVAPEIIVRAEQYMMQAKRGPARVQALVDFLSLPAPEGLGLVYDWNSTGGASSTIASGRGNCVSLATVLVALGRGIGWPIYYAEARARFPETQEFESLRALSDHMVVLVAVETFQMVIDFTGQLAELEDLRPIDDLTAYAHIINNTTAQRLMIPGLVPDDEQWQVAINGFRLAARIQPELGRAWNNLGIALTRLERFKEAREAYQQAVALDTAFGSAQLNLTIMETRALGDVEVLERTRPHSFSGPGGD